mmetsp:Transcript_20197/g.36657  ORF Transcript_20197/g.36657 Transcript_20197/m.36657 type:complete len:93 (+) Transcript_20197:329-607(+)
MNCGHLYSSSSRYDTTTPMDLKSHRFFSLSLTPNDFHAKITDRTILGTGSAAFQLFKAYHSAGSFALTTNHIFLFTTSGKVFKPFVLICTAI